MNSANVRWNLNSFSVFVKSFICVISFKIWTVFFPHATLVDQFRCSYLRTCFFSEVSWVRSPNFYPLGRKCWGVNPFHWTVFWKHLVISVEFSQNLKFPFLCSRWLFCFQGVWKMWFQLNYADHSLASSPDVGCTLQAWRMQSSWYCPVFWKYLEVPTWINLVGTGFKKIMKLFSNFPWLTPLDLVILAKIWFVHFHTQHDCSASKECGKCDQMWF